MTPKAATAPALTDPNLRIVGGIDEFKILPTKSLRPSTTNARQIFDETKLRELAESIRKKGILEPLIVRPAKGSGSLGRYELVAGERRWRAATLAELDQVPAIIRCNLTDKDAEEIQTIENDQREDLNPIERGAGYVRLIERHGYTVDTLAEAVGKSKTFIHDQLKLAKLPELAREALLDGRIPQSTATLIARIPNETKRTKAADEIIKPQWRQDPLSFRDARDHIERKFSIQLKGACFSREDATLVPAAGACVTCSKLTGNNRVEFPDGRADICTDPPCFNSKIAAFDARTRKQAKEKEIKVLPASETKRLFSPYGNTLARGSSYIDLAEQCSEDKQKKSQRSYKQLLGEDAEPVLAINPRTHRAHYVMPAKDVAKLLEKKHSIKINVTDHRADRAQSRGAGERYRKQEEQRREKQKSF